jgi:hypothetical protein
LRGKNPLEIQDLSPVLFVRADGFLVNKFVLMPNSIRTLLIVLVTLGGLLYAGTIVYAVVLTLSKETKIDALLLSAVTVIGGVLATNFGAVLGVTFTPPAPIPAVLPRFLGLRPSLPSPGTNGDAGTDAAQKLQIIACWVYVGGLVIAFTGWLIAKFNSVPETQMQTLLPELVRTLLGVIVGAITVALGRANPV